MDQDYRVTKFLSLLRDEGAWVQRTNHNHFHRLSAASIIWNPLLLLSSSSIFIPLPLPRQLVFFSLTLLLFLSNITDRMYFEHGSVMSHTIFILIYKAPIWCVSTLHTHTHTEQSLRCRNRRTISHQVLTLTALFCNHQGERRRSNPNLSCWSPSPCIGKVNSKGKGDSACRVHSLSLPL